MPDNDQPDTADEPNTSTQDDGGTDGGDDSGKPDELGEAGKKAIAAERTKARNEAAKRRKLEQELAALKAATAKPADADKPPTVDAKAIAEQAKAEARAELLKDRAADKIEVLAAKTFANPELARRLLNVDDFIADGRVDTDAIKDSLAELLEQNPGLAAAPPKRFNGSADQGPRNSKAPDLDQLIAAAQKAGDVRQVIHLQNQKMLPQIQQMLGGPAAQNQRT